MLTATSKKTSSKANEDSQVGVSKNLIGKKRIQPDELPEDYQRFVAGMSSSKQQKLSSINDSGLSKKKVQKISTTKGKQSDLQSRMEDGPGIFSSYDKFNEAAHEEFA